MFQIEKFDSYREDNRMEIKKAKGGLPNSLWESYSSFANGYGGVIILGVEEEEDGTWRKTGLQDATKLRKEFWDIINNKQKVSLNILNDQSVMTYEEDDTVIMVITVPKAKREQKPIYINNQLFEGTYRRNWEGDYVCTRLEVKGMLRDQPEETSDMKVLDDFQIEDLCYESIHGYRNYHASINPGHAWEKLNDEQYLERVGAAAISKKDHQLHPTAAGLLMFGEEYKIVREYPEYFLDYREMLDPTIRWSDRVQSSSGNWSGNLFDFFFRIYNKISKDVKVPFKLVNGIRIDDTPVHKALREALANCLINADYFVPRGIVVKKEADSIVLENPGCIRTGKDQMRKGGISDPRNKALMKLFNLINIGERAGSGVPDIFGTWEKEGWIAPKIEEEYGVDRTRLTLSFLKQSKQKPAIKTGDKKPAIKSDDNSITSKTKEHYQKIMAFLKWDQEYKLQEFSDLLGIKKSRTKEIVKALVEKEVLESLGYNRNRRYRLRRKLE